MANNCVLVGHRGYPELYPENTLLGMKAAVDAGIPALELDIQLSKDHVCVLVHDPDLQRVAKDPRNVRDLTWEQLKRISVHEPDRFNEKFLTTYISSLNEISSVLAKAEVVAFIELKQDSLALVSADKLIQLALNQSEPLAQKRIIISFNRDIVALAKTQYSQKTGWVLNKYDVEHLEILRKLKPDIAIVNYKKIPKDIETLPQGEWQWFVYDVVDKKIAEWCARIGVYYIESWNPVALMNHPPFRAE